MAKLKFKVGSLLKNIIGKDLITDDFIAIYELVKNSYDAHAKNVVITFEDSKIIIADDGKGMSLKDLKEKWLFVAYSAKADDTEDEELKNTYREKIKVRKHYAGSKGIGRFSCDRLGENLKVVTQKLDSDICTILNVNWLDFEKNPKKEFRNITVEHEELENIKNIFPNKSQNGTILEISDLTGKWNRAKLLKLKQSLEKLINPFEESEGFSIQIICKKELENDTSGTYKENLKGSTENRIGTSYINRDKVNGKIKNNILDILEQKTTQINIRFSEEKITTTINDRGELIYTIEEKNPYSLLKNLKIDLYYLNTIAKRKFTMKMGTQVVNFGSVFLFKNGFRIQPYGNYGDDSWSLDSRAQQGYNRHLSTRNLLGRVDIITDNQKEFQEVSSRDAGLIKTDGTEQLFNAFKDKALVRLERYVVGVLWGEGFKKRGFFGKDDEGKEIAEKYRQNLLDNDKHSEDVNIAKSNLASKLDFIQIIKSLATDKDVVIIDYNKNFIKLVNENIEEVKKDILFDLKQIAKKNSDEVLLEEISVIERKQKQLKSQIAKALNDVETERLKREEAETKQREAEEKKEKAEIEKLRAENEKLKAEQKARIAEEEKEKAKNEAQKKDEQVKWYKATTSIEYKDLEQSNHIIGVYADTINNSILLMKMDIDEGKQVSNADIYSFLQEISLSTDKILTLTKFTTKSNFRVAMIDTEADIVKYIIDYINNTLKKIYKIEFEIQNQELKFIKSFKPIELCTALDNILSNSLKKNASKIIYSFSINSQRNLCISIKDVGATLSSEIKNHQMIFEEGITTTDGAGLGLANVKSIVENDLNGTIKYNPEYTDGFELIIELKE